MKRKVPRLKSDAAVDAFLNQDLSDLDFSQFHSTRFDGRVEPNHEVLVELNMRLPASLLDAVKRRASARGIPYTRLIREAVEHVLAQPLKPR
jgi:predicted DNA binding CopG/RHH family protein